MKEEFRECFRWKADNMPETTEAIVVVSNKGVVKKLEHKCWNKKNNNYSVYKENIYKIKTNRGKQRHDSEDKIKKNGLYQYVGINQKHYSVHRLVAEAFIPNPNMLPQVNNINGRRDNNNVYNLEWCNNSENQIHAISNNLKKTGEFITISEKDINNVLELRLKYFRSQQISKEVGISHETVRNIFNKFLEEEEDIKIKIKSFSKIISKKESGIQSVGKTYYFKHSNLIKEKFKNKESALKFKDKYINNNFKSDT